MELVNRKIRSTDNLLINLKKANLLKGRDAKSPVYGRIT